MLLIAVPVAFLIGVLTMATPFGAFFFAPLFLSCVAGSLILRFALIFPATALGNSMKLLKAWSAKRRFKKALFVMLLCQLVVEVITEAVPSVLPTQPSVGLAWSYASYLFVALLNISIYTTMYGIFI